MKAFIISNGQIKNYDFYTELFEKEDPRYVICVDGGAKHLKKLGITPDYIIGDLDSISLKDLKYYENQNVSIKRYNVEKDYPDTQLALEFAMTLPITEIIFLGSIGSRMDHTLANIYLLESAVKNGFKASIINENNTIQLISNQIELQGKKDDIISLLPLSDRVEGINTKGLYYPLENGVMEKYNFTGISNKFISEKIRISIKSGLLLLILARD